MEDNNGSKKRESTLKLNFGIWRSYSPVNLVDSETGSNPSSAILPSLIRSLGFLTLEDFQKEIRSMNRHELSKDIQARIRKIFNISRLDLGRDQDFIFRDIEIGRNRNRTKIPFPCTPKKRMNAKIEFGDFAINRKRSAIEIRSRFGLSTNNFLSPISTESESLWRNLISNPSPYDADDSTLASLENWLISCGITKRKARGIITDEGAVSGILESINDRIEEIVGVHAEVAIDNGEKITLIPDGEEEKGYSSK